MWAFYLVSVVLVVCAYHLGRVDERLRKRHDHLRKANTIDLRRIK